MKRGSICWVDFEPSTGAEFGKTRPALIVSNSEQNLTLNSVVVIPLSSRAPEIWPVRLKLSLSKGKDSYAVLPGIRQIDKSRIEDFAGAVSEASLDRIDEALELYLRD